MVEKSTKNIAIVVPVFNEESGIKYFYEMLNQVLFEIAEHHFTLIFVDDGSNDQTVAEINKIMVKSPSVGLIQLVRNFGKEAALTAAVRKCAGYDAVITIDADLQHPPELIPDLLEGWANNFLVVTTVRKSVRSHSFLRIIGSKIFYIFLRLGGVTHVIPGGTDYRLIDRTVVKAFCMLQEPIYMYRNSIDWFEFKTKKVLFDAPRRFDGQSNYSYKQLALSAIYSIFSYSNLPAKCCYSLGLLIVLLGAASALLPLVFESSGTNWARALQSIVIFSIGSTLMFLSLVLVYLKIIKAESGKRPQYLILNSSIPISPKEGSIDV